MVRTSPFHGENTGSIPVRDTFGKMAQLVRVLVCHAKGCGFKSRFSRFNSYEKIITL
jgi:hypothetical protein